MIKVRFAPSPTGYLHIGGARTALFNWMYARSQAGKFILRIEDTDLERSKPEFIDEILKSMEWLGLKWDEFYRQGERFPIYQEHARKLLNEGKAVSQDKAVILKTPAEPVKLFDIIRGEILFAPETMKDEVLIKSDGSPTYSFACVVDDALMGVTHVIRGEDHIPNTPKQIQMYKALGFAIPKFAHLPLIMGPDGGRLSKRTGAVAVSEYQAMGFLPEALVNYLMLLGWSPGENQEIITLESAVKKFSIKKINKASAMFSMEKLKWINQQYIKQTGAEGLADLLTPLLREKGYIQESYDRARLIHIVDLYHGRLATLTDFLERADYLFVDEVSMESGAKTQYLTQDKKPGFEKLIERLKPVSDFNVENTERVFREVVGELKLDSGALVHPVRVALTGKTVGIGLFETMALLGKEKTIKRLSEVFD